MALPDDYSERLDGDKKSGVGVNGNLRLATVGEVRNPKGKPKGTKNRSTLYREWLEMGSHEADVMKALITKAADGDVSAIKEIFDGAYGKLTDKIDANITSNPVSDILNGIDGATASRPTTEPTE